MSVRRRRSGAVPAISLALAAALAGCAGHAEDWLEPDWDRVIASEARREQPVAGLPRVDPAAGTPLPDLSADGTLDLSIEQAVFLALSNNRDLAVSRLSPVIVGAFELVERGEYDPELFAEAGFGKEETVESARATEEQFGVRGDDVSLGAGVRQRLPSGTDVEAGVTQDRSISSRSPEQQAARLGLSVTQALLRGAGPEVNLATIRVAELDTLASVYELRGLAEALLAETEIAYWRYVLAQREIEIFERSLAVARQQLGELRQRVEVGVLAPTEQPAAESEVALREQALIEARSAMAASRLELLRLMNPTEAGSLDHEVRTTSEPLLRVEPIADAPDRIALAMQARPDLNEARLRLEQNRLEVIVTRNGLLPRLDLFIALGKTGFADTFPDSFRELDGPTYDFTAGVSYSRFLGNRTARGLNLAAIASRQQAATAVQNLQQLVELDVLLAVNEAERARQQIDASRRTREFQERTVEAEIERFRAGASTSLQVAQAQRDLLQAQINEVSAVVAHRIALVELYLAEGSLLERRGVSVSYEG